MVTMTTARQTTPPMDEPRSPSQADPAFRDLAANLSPEAMRLWPHLPAFIRFVLDRSLNAKRPAIRPAVRSHPKAIPFRGRRGPGPLDDTEDDLVGTFLFSLVITGALYRATIDRDLIKLTTDNLILGERWFQMDAFRQRTRVASGTRSQSQQPARRHLQVRFPLSPLCRSLLYRVARFYQTSQPRRGSGTAPQPFDLRRPGHPLFSDRIRHRKNFLRTWVAQRYADFQAEYRPLGAAHTTGTPPFPIPAPWGPLWPDIMHACQAHLLTSLPPWIVAGLSRRWMSRPSTQWDIARILLDQPLPAGTWTHEDELPQALQPAPPPAAPRRTWIVPEVLPPGLQQAYTEANRILQPTTSGLLPTTRTLCKRQVDAILHRLSPKAVAADASISPDLYPLYDNARLVFEWLRTLLSSKRALNTVRLYFFNLLIFVYQKFGTRPFSETTAEELIAIVVECMQCYDNPESQRNVKKSFRSFFQFLASHKHIPILDWRDPDLQVYRDATDRPVFSFRDIAFLLEQVTKKAQTGDISMAHATRLRAFIILCFYAGLRRGEAAQLTVADFEDGPETLLWVGHSKTPAGRRVLPLHLLMPARYLRDLRHQRDAALGLAQGRPTTAVPLLPNDQGAFCTPKSYGDSISALMKGNLQAGSAHDLRHSFATWFLVRWYLAFHPVPAGLPEQEFPHEIFAEETVRTQFRTLVVGQIPQGRRHGADAVTRPLSLLQTLMGHASPEITLSVYAHSLDWIYYLHLLNQKGTNPLLTMPHPLTIRQVANLLQQTPARLYGRRQQRRQPRGAPVPNSLDAVLQEQMQLLGHTDPGR